MSQRPLISIIVPVYNVERYLSECLDSILAQTLTNFEVIAVDDGSPDNCGKILDEYSQKDKRIRVIHKENGGVSSARNAGLDIATGEYVGFVDPDDTIFPDVYEYLYNEAKSKDFDVVQCGCVQVNENGEAVQYISCDVEREYENTNDMLCDFFNCIIINSVCTKIFKSKLFEKIRFRQNLRIAEDEMFVHDCLSKANRLKVTKKCGYCYTISNSSVIHSGISEKIFDNLIVLDRLNEIYKKNEYVQKCFREHKAKMILDILFNVLTTEKFLERLPELVERTLDVKESIFKGKFSKKEKVFTLMLSVAPNATCRLAIMYSNRKK